MEVNTIIGIILAVLVLSLIIWVITGSKKKIWYKVYMANNDVMLLYRDLNERWWRTSDRYMRFKTEQGVEITFPSNAHWVLFWEAIPEGTLDVAREEVKRAKDSAADK